MTPPEEPEGDARQCASLLAEVNQFFAHLRKFQRAISEEEEEETFFVDGGVDGAVKKLETTAVELWWKIETMIQRLDGNSLNGKWVCDVCNVCDLCCCMLLIYLILHMHMLRCTSMNDGQVCKTSM